MWWFATECIRYIISALHFLLTSRLATNRVGDYGSHNGNHGNGVTNGTNNSANGHHPPPNRPNHNLIPSVFQTAKMDNGEIQA